MIELGGKKLCLGTVQLGMKYGVKNELGRQPTEEESFAVLRAAQKGGVEYLDTASVYGEAETLLGHFDVERAGFHVISKLRPWGSEATDKGTVLLEIEASLQRLKVRRLYGYMLHRAEDMENEAVVQGMIAAKERGYTEHIGVSVYEPEEALRVVRSGVWDMIQIPYNVLDQRLDESDFFELAKKNHVKVFARSAFLQGLLLMESEQIPPHLIKARSYIEKFRQVIAQYQYTPEEGAMLYSYSHPEIDCVVFGVDTITQLIRNLGLCSKADSFGDCWKELHGAFSNVPREIIVPSLWN